MNDYIKLATKNLCMEVNNALLSAFEKCGGTGMRTEVECLSRTEDPFDTMENTERRAWSPIINIIMLGAVPEVPAADSGADTGGGEAPVSEKLENKSRGNEYAAQAAEAAPPTVSEMEEQVMKATCGWNVPAVFASSWSRWQALWRHLLLDDDFRRRMARRRPNSTLNHTQINMQMVAGVCRYFKKDLRCQLADKRLADFISHAWEGDSARGFIGQRNTVLTRADTERVLAWLTDN